MALVVKPSCSVEVSVPASGLRVVPSCADIPGPPFSDTATLFWWPFEEASDAPRVDAVHTVPLAVDDGLFNLQAAAKVGNGVSFTPNPNQYIIMQSAITEALAYAGGGFDAMFWLKINTYGASSQVLVPRFRFYDADENQLSGFTFDAFNAGVASIFSSNNGESVGLASPTVPEIGVWYCFRVFYDDSDKKVGIQVNNGSVTKSDDAYVAAMPVAAKGQCGVWHLGSGGGSLDDFIVDELVCRIGSLFTPAEIISYFNSGSGRTYP